MIRVLAARSSPKETTTTSSSLKPDRLHDFLVRPVGDDRLGGTVPDPLDGLLVLVDGDHLEAAFVELLDEIEAEDPQSDHDDPLLHEYASLPDHDRFFRVGDPFLWLLRASEKASVSGPTRPANIIRMMASF